MTWHSFFGALRIPALRDLPIAYGIVVVTQVGYLLLVLRGWLGSERGK